MFLKQARMTVVSLALSGMAFATAAPGWAAGPLDGAVKPLTGGSSANVTAAAPIINRILDRWYPVASELKQDVAVWRAQFRAVLERASPQTLQSLDAMEAKSAGVNRTLVQAYQYAFAEAVADTGAQLAKETQRAATEKLGSPTTDLVFVGFKPCRIVDTRNVGGPIAAGTQVNFYYYSDGTPASWQTSQGGDPGAVATACPNTVLTAAGGTLGTVAPAAAVATVTAVNTSAAGNFIVWGGGSPSSIPNTSALNWDHAGEVIANTTVIPWGGRTGGNLDFTVRYNGPTGSSNVVVDVVGYMIENTATALDCTTTSNSGSIAIGTGTDSTVAYTACPTGYTRTGGFCNGGGSTGTSGIYLIESGPTSCVFRNLGGSAGTGFAVNQCCRVPGR
jgi:hypothetical protein